MYRRVGRVVNRSESSVAAAYSAKSKPASPVYIPRTGRKGQEGSRGGGAR